MPVITFAGENLIAQQQQAGNTLIIDQMILANINGLDHNLVPNRSEAMPSVGDIKITQPITKDGLINSNTVVYSAVFTSTQGTFDFNWMGLYSSEHNVLVAVAYIPVQSKRATLGAAIGNIITKNFAIEFNGAVDVTGINVSAESWQIDYTERNLSMDTLQRDMAKIIYGQSVYVGDAFKIKYSNGKYYLTLGGAVLGGLKDELSQDYEITPGALPQTVWLDVYQEATMVGVQNSFDVVFNDGTGLTDNTVGAVKHSLVRIGTINSTSDIVDERGNVTSSLTAYNQGNIPHADTTKKGIAKLNSDIESLSESEAATPKAVLDYVQKQKTKLFSTLVDAAADTSLIVGQQVKTIINGIDYVVVATATGIDDGGGLFTDMANGKQLAVIRKNVATNMDKLRAFVPDYDGQEIMLLGHSKAGLGGGPWFFDRGDTDSEDNNGTCVVNPLGNRIKRNFNGVANLYMFGCLGDGSDDSVGFQNAANAGDFHIPKCPVHFLVGGITVPANRVITGESSYVYTAFNASDVVGLGAVVYDITKDTFISWGVSCDISHCTFHGVDRSRPFQEGTGGGLKMFKTAVFRCAAGFGRTAHYTMGNCRLLECHFSGNTLGVAGLVDSHVAICEINANEASGVRASAGCNDTVYIDNKVEWNNTKGYEFYGNQSSIQIIGGIVDRNGEAGISATGYAGVLVLGVKFRRNGRESELNAEQDCHVALRGGSQKHFSLVNCNTAAGTGDSGEGYASPSRAIVASNNSSVIGLVSGCDLTGVTTEVFKERSGGSLTINSFVGNDVEGVALGSDVTFISEAGNTGLPEIQTITDYGDMVYRGGTGTISAATDVVLTGLASVNTYSRYAYDVHIVSRDTGDDTYAIIHEAKVVVVRGGGGALSEVIMLYSSHPSLVLTAALTTEIDGSEITLTVTPDRAMQVVMIVTQAY